MTTLILTPTRLELRTLEPVLRPTVRRVAARLDLCGFGPIAAAARTMQLIAMYQPTRVILVGIAGGLRPEIEIGTARVFREVACGGIGAGSGTDHKSAGKIGWKHWPCAESAADELPAGIGDVIPLAECSMDAKETAGRLLTVCAASANESDVAAHLAWHPDAVAEDMEGFGVAVACCFGDVPLQIIRGISNRSGDRDTTNWDIGRALHAAGELTIRALSAESAGDQN